MKPRTKKILIIAGVSVGVLAVGTIIAVPIIASAIAPGIIQNAAADSIKGSLRVSDVSVGWTGPTRIGSIELLDDKGIVVAKLQATSTLGILSVLSGLNDLGTLTLTGTADITARQTDAGTLESNFQRAIAPRNATPPSASIKPSPLPEKTIRVDITSIDVKYTQLDRAGAPVASAQITALKGDAAVDLRRSQPSASLNLTGGIKQPAQPDGSIKITTKAQKFLSPQGTPDLSAATIDTDVQITAAPVGLIDALAGLNGQLREALGPAADLRLKAQGTTQQAAIDLTLTSAGALVDGSMKITNGYLESTKPLTTNLRSTDFLFRSPAISKALASSNITLDAAAPAPAASFTITSLRVPTNFSNSAFDARGISIIASASIDPIAAQITTSDAAGTRQRPVRTSPLNLTVESTDLAKGLTVRGGGTASIDSTPAGDLMINIAASDLLTDRGTLRPVPGQIQAEASLMNIDTRLAQPLLGDLAQRISLSQELGPRLDIRALAKAAAATPNAIEADVSVKAQNIAASLPIIVDNASLRTRSDLAVNINRTTGVLNAFLRDQGVVISGTGAANLRGGFTLPRTSTGSFDTPALASFLSFDLAALDAAITREGQTRRVGLSQLKGTLAVVPNTPTKLQAQASGDDGWSFNTDLQLQGLLPSSTPSGSPLPFLAARRVTGTLSLRSLPTKYAALSGLDESKLRTIAGVLGPSVSTEISLQGTAVQQQFTAVITSTNLNTQLGATLTESAATLNALQGNLRLTPEGAEAITTLLQASAPQARASATGDLTFKVTINKPIAIKPAPAAATAGQSSSPTFDFSAVAINSAVTSPEGLRVTNLPLSPTRTFTGGVRNLQLTADAPLAALINPTSKEGHLGAQLRADLIEGQFPEPVASINADFDAAASLTEFKLQSSITNIDSQRIDTMLNQPGLVSGALGSPASITISATKEGPGTTKANATVQSPRLNLTGLALTQQGKALALTAPAEFTWTVEPAFLDQTLFAQSDPAARPAAPASLRVTQPITLNGKLESLALGIEGVGLFQPGVFALDASLSASTIKLSSPASTSPPAPPAPPIPGARTAANQPTEQTDIEGFTIRIKGDTNLSVKAAATRVITSTNTTAAPSTSAAPAPAAGSLSAEVLVKNFASPAGELDLSRALIDAKIDAPSLPTALVDKLARTGKQLRNILGPEMSIALNAKNISPSQPANPTTTNTTIGTVDARLTSVKPTDAPNQPAATTTPATPRQQANLELTGPVDRGVLKVSPQKPLSISLAQLKFESDTEIMGVLPLFASIQKTAGTTIQPATPTQPAIIEPPFTVTSPDLMIPLDGDIAKLNGNLTISPGRIEYVFKRELGNFLDRTLLTDGELMQRPIPPFVVSFTNGIASYTDVRLPVRNFEFKLTGKVDLVRKEIDAVIYIPTVAASASIMSKLNDDLGRGFGGILPDVLSEGTMVPLRVTGPLSNPAYAPDPKLFFENFGSQLKKPADIIGKGIERGLGELFKPRDDKDKEKPKPR